MLFGNGFPGDRGKIIHTTLPLDAGHDWLSVVLFWDGLLSVSNRPSRDEPVIKMVPSSTLCVYVATVAT